MRLPCRRRLLPPAPAHLQKASARAHQATGSSGEPSGRRLGCTPAMLPAVAQRCRCTPRACTGHGIQLGLPSADEWSGLSPLNLCCTYSALLLPVLPHWPCPAPRCHIFASISLPGGTRPPALSGCLYLAMPCCPALLFVPAPCPWQPHYRPRQALRPLILVCAACKPSSSTSVQPHACVPAWQPAPEQRHTTPLQARPGNSQPGPSPQERQPLP